METLDLRAQADSRLALAAISALREAGGELVLLTRDEPGLLMASLDLQLRNALSWETRAAGGHWETVVRRAQDIAPRDLVDLLVREHRVLDECLGRALRRLNAGDLPAAKVLIVELGAGLRRHIRNENDVLAPTLGPGEAFAPLQVMLAEHDELLAQLAAVEETLDGEAWELESYAAMLSGTLAKHEHREETGLFPRWRAALAALDAPARERLRQALHAPD